MNTMYIGLLATAAILVAGAGNVAALSFETNGRLVSEIADVEIGGLGSSCIGWGGSNGVCWGVYENNLNQFCVGIWSGSRCTGVQV